MNRIYGPLPWMKKISQWIDIGEPTVERIKKASRLAEAVKVYSFNTKSDVWWDQNANKFKQLNAQYFRFEWTEIQAIAKFVERTMDFSVTITDSSAYIATSLGECEVAWQELGAK